MKPFLEELAEKIILQEPHLEEVTLVFPNRRAALFFQKYLAEKVTRPVWSPQLLTIEELFRKMSPWQEADKLGLVFRLYQVYNKVMNHSESFDRFYFWGEMLLRDFDEVDKYMVPAALLFRDLSHLRELDDSFDYLTDEQKKFLQDFWVKFEDKPSGNKEEFLKVWRELPRVYTEFVKKLRKEGLAYEGMMHREVADSLSRKAPSITGRTNQYIFAGFNALTRAEELLLSYFVNGGAKVYWDLDEYYVNDTGQEAGRFFRQYRKHEVLGKTFDSELAAHLKGEKKQIDLNGVPQKWDKRNCWGNCWSNR